MARKNDTPQKAAMRELMSGYLKQNNVKIKDGTDVNAIMRDMMSVILEGALDEEMNEELGYSKYDYRNKETDNSRNGHSQKTMHTSYGDMEIDIPRDRKGEYEPQVVKKYQNTVTQDMEEKILSMYAKGMTTHDIESHMRELYDIDISDSTISRITDKILPIVKEWQERPLEEIYAVVFLDAVHFHVRSEGRIVKQAVYIAIGIDMSGRKDVLGMYVGQNESAKFWLSILNGLKNRGVEDILIACVDGLSGFPQAIEAVYPQTEIQQHLCADLLHGFPHLLQSLFCHGISVLLGILGALAANELRAGAGAQDICFADLGKAQPHRHGHPLQVHADEGAADVDARVGADLLHGHRVLEVLPAGSGPAASGMGPGHHAHFLPAVFFRSFPLDDNGPVQMLTALRCQPDAVFGQHRGNACIRGAF